MFRKISYLRDQHCSKREQLRETNNNLAMFYNLQRIPSFTNRNQRSEIIYNTKTSFRNPSLNTPKIPNNKQISILKKTPNKTNTTTICNNSHSNNTSKSIQNNDIKIKLKFSINDLVNYAYCHSPVVSMSCKAPLQEIITTQPLVNLYDDDDKTRIFYLTYIYYKTEDKDRTPILNGYGYLTCNFFQNTSYRSIFTVTSITTQLLSNVLFGLDPIPLTNGNYSENVYLLNNNTGETDYLVLSVKQVDDDRIVTIETP
jgi:hypothetical protein